MVLAKLSFFRPTVGGLIVICYLYTDHAEDYTSALPHIKKFDRVEISNLLIDVRPPDPPKIQIGSLGKTFSQFLVSA